MIQKILARAAFTACLSGAVLGVAVAHAADFSAEYVFGDSLSDNGNLAELLTAEGKIPDGFPNPPSYHDSNTNGPVSVQLLAQSLGLNATPSLWLTGFKDPANLFDGPSFVPGTNYAVAGATSATPARVSINLLSQVGAYSGFVSDHADPNALYVVMIGGNDVRNAALGPIADANAAISDGVMAELAAISTLSSEGAKHFLVVNVPNVGVIPEFALDAPSLAPGATTLSQEYDEGLAAGLADLHLSAGATLTDFDLFGFNAGIAADFAALGFTNTTEPCYSDAPLSAASTPDAAPRISIVSCTGMTFIRLPGSTLFGPRVSGPRRPSLRPGRCC
jgi:phospholipase/lecithinase/hemolysin